MYAKTKCLKIEAAIKQNYIDGPLFADDIVLDR